MRYTDCKSDRRRGAVTKSTRRKPNPAKDPRCKPEIAPSARHFTQPKPSGIPTMTIPFRAVIGLGLLLLLPFASCEDTYEWRQKLTIVVDTPQGERTGSTVQSLSWARAKGL